MTFQSALQVGPTAQSAVETEAAGDTDADEAWPDEITRLHGVLTGASSRDDERIGAAKLLLDRGDTFAVDALIDAINTTRPEIDAAVAQVVAESFTEPPAELIEPLWRRLREAPNGRDLLARALGRFDSPACRALLLEHAGDVQQSIKVRRGAIQALGHHRAKNVAEQLVGLLDESQPQEVATAAMSALQTLSGLHQLGMDRAAWRSWWESVEPLDTAGWRKQLVHNLAVADRRHRDQIQRMRVRLVEAQRSLYRFADSQHRSTTLVEMLRDPLAEIRNLGIDLSLQRLLDNQTFGNDLLNALRERMTDSDPAIRERTALLLRDLGDEAAADIAVLRLAGDRERDEPCVRALYRLLERVPRKGALEPALADLKNPAVRADAAGALTRFAKENWLSDQQAEAALATARASNNGASPQPQVISLLAALGSEADWQRIAGWIGNEDVRVKQAAARAWADSDRPLAVLSRRLDDPVIQPIFLAAAAKRGKSAETLSALANFVPLDAQTRQAWERALLAIAGRAEPVAVLSTVETMLEQAASADAPAPLTEREAAQQLLRQDVFPTLSEQLLSAAINRAAPELQPLEQVDLVIARANARLNLIRPADALADLQTAGALLAGDPPKVTLTPGQRSKLLDTIRLLNVRGLLQLGEINRAAQIARSRPGIAMSETTPNAVLPADDPAIDIFLKAARRYAQLERIEKAHEVVSRLYLLVGPDADDDLLERIKLLEAEIAGATTPAIEEADAPVPNGE